jgi:hypothetical protein
LPNSFAGDYDLKVMRQEYYISQQKKVRCGHNPLKSWYWNCLNGHFEPAIFLSLFRGHSSNDVSNLCLLCELVEEINKSFSAHWVPVG